VHKGEDKREDYLVLDKVLPGLVVRALPCHERHSAVPGCAGTAESGLAGPFRRFGLVGGITPGRWASAALRGPGKGLVQLPYRDRIVEEAHDGPATADLRRGHGWIWEIADKEG